MRETPTGDEALPVDLWREGGAWDTAITVPDSG